ncbi:sRNA-binding protein [Paraburkholderia graminis]|uniref:SRNA-binding protein n=1 Tax=Paraburkholderia graminis TaxID=60548 RepID=A0ABD5CSH6_9BURK|nr:sRNA-binding protein [Paraburkholderia graminis]
MRAEKIQCEPDFQRRQHALQRLPEEQIAQHDGAAPPDQLDRQIDLRGLSNKCGELAARDVIERARHAFERTRVLHEREQNEKRRQHDHAPRKLPSEPQRARMRVRKQKTNADHREQQLADHGQLHIGDDARHRRGRPHAPAPEHAERHHFSADARDRQHAIDRFAHPYEMQHVEHARAVRAANQRAPVAGIGEHRQNMCECREQKPRAGGAQRAEHRDRVVPPHEPQRRSQSRECGHAPEMLHHADTFRAFVARRACRSSRNSEDVRIIAA